MIILRFYVYILAWFCFVTGVFGQDELDSLDEAIGEVTEASISSLHMRVEELERRNRELSTALMALGERLETLQELGVEQVRLVTQSDPAAKSMEAPALTSSSEVPK